MSAICIAGESGTGKSTSVGQTPELGIEGLPPEKTVYINVANKDLPFRGWKNKYKGKINEGGNYLESSNASTIASAISYIEKERDDIEYIVIDDVQYIMAFEFMSRAKEVGYQKFSDIGVNMSKILSTAKNSNKKIFFMWHPELDEKTEFKLKTVGKMLENYFNPQGLFTIVLYSKAEADGDDVNYGFVTNKDGMYQAKSPIGMFDKFIPNDLGYVVKKIDEYNEG